MALALDGALATPALRPLANRAYTDAGFLAAELAAVWGSGWFCVGFAHEVPEPGCVRPVDVAGKPLLMARDHDAGSGSSGTSAVIAACASSMRPPASPASSAAPITRGAMRWTGR